MKAYRVENQEKGNGIWRNFDGTLNPIFDKLSDGLAKSLPMEDNDYYKERGKQWFSACDEKWKLPKWFSKQDVLEMREMGYEVWEFDAFADLVKEGKVVLTREEFTKSVIEVTYANKETRRKLWEKAYNQSRKETVEKIFRELLKDIIEINERNKQGEIEYTYYCISLDHIKKVATDVGFEFELETKE